MSHRISDLIPDGNYLRITGLGPEFHLKLESLNAAGSIKIKTALGLIEDLQERGVIRENSILIESSSGNLGVALAMICAERHLRFTCVVDPNSSEHNVRIMRSCGAEVVRIDKPDANGGFLGSRIAYIRDKLAIDPRYLWLNQYENPANPRMHARTTARSIARNFDHVDYLFVGAGTTGTLMGCVQYFQRYSPTTRIIAVDSVGSVTFGTPPGRRYIPGLGTSQTPGIFDSDGIHALELVPEARTIAMCRHLARTRGLLVGGSTGTVISGLHAWRDRIPEDAIVVALSPDWGERYLDTIYDDAWVEARFGRAPLDPSLALAVPEPNATCWLQHERDRAAGFHVIDGQTVSELLDADPRACIDDVERAYLDHDAGLTVNPDSHFLRFSHQPNNRIIALPASLGGEAAVNGIKWIASYPDNIRSGLQRASAVLLLNDPTTGYAYACMEASRISAMRTAASAVLAVRALRGTQRRLDRLAVIGAGYIARHIIDMLIADGWQAESLLVHDHDDASRAALITHAGERLGYAADAARSLDDALDADVVVLATTAGTPYIEGHKFRASQLVLNISLRDLAPDIIAGANNLLDDIDHCLKANTSPDLAVRRYGHRAFINGTLAGYLCGKVWLSPERPTIFSPFGLGILDLAVGKRIYDEALRLGRALPVPRFHANNQRW